MARKRRRKNKQKPQNTSQDMLCSPTGAGSDLDRGRDFHPGGNIKTAPWGLDPYSYFYGLWDGTWEGKKMVNIPPQDMTREGWKWKTPEATPVDIKKIEEAENDLGLLKTIEDALVFERLYGGAVIVLGTNEQAGLDPATPLDVNTIGKGDLRFVRALDRTGITATSVNTDPMSPHYRKPELFTIGSHQVHRSRLLVFDGGGDKTPIGATVLQDSYIRSDDGFGRSIFQSTYDDIIRAVGVRQAAFHLIFMLSIPIFKKAGVIKGGMAATKSGDDVRKNLEKIMSDMSIFKGVLLDKDDDITNFKSQVTEAVTLIITQLQVLAAGCDIPATRFLGDAPGGLQATGKGDLANYYDSIRSRQTVRLAPQLNKLKPILVRSALGVDIPELYVDFNPLIQLSEDQRADMRNKDWKNVNEAFAAGIGDAEWVRKEVMERRIFDNEPTFKVVKDVIVPTEPEPKIDTSNTPADVVPVIPNGANTSPTDGKDGGLPNSLPSGE